MMFPKTKYKRISKASIWNKERAKLKKVYFKKGITTCEFRSPKCWKNNALSFAHRHKRFFYTLHPELLGEFNETLLVCVPCHQILEYDEELTELTFKVLRPYAKTI